MCVEIIKAATRSGTTEVDLMSSTRQAVTTVVSGGTIKDCLRVLVSIGFVSHDETLGQYKTTEQGKRFAAVFDEIWMAGEEVEQANMISYNKKNYT